jgi:hypothetical protein
MAGEPFGGDNHRLRKLRAAAAINEFSDLMATA